MTSEINAIEDLKILCAAWQERRDTDTFAQIVQTCLEAQVITPAKFRDGLDIPPGAPMLWAKKKADAPILMQEEIVEFVASYINHLTY